MSISVALGERPERSGDDATIRRECLPLFRPTTIGMHANLIAAPPHMECNRAIRALIAIRFRRERPTMPFERWATPVDGVSGVRGAPDHGPEGVPLSGRANRDMPKGVRSISV